MLLLVAAVRVLLHSLSNGQYGFHRDELQTLDDARHLDWGFVAYPPLTPLLGRVELLLFGTSLVGFRVAAAVAVSLAMVIAGLMTRELGGGRGAQLLTAIAVGVSPVSLIQGAVLQYVAFDYLFGILATYFCLRLLRTGDPRFWVAIGATLGLGMETRYTAGFLALAIGGATLLTTARRELLRKWRWVGALTSLVVFLPNLVWQARHGFISLDFLKHIHARDVAWGRAQGFFPDQAFLCINVATVPLALLGLWFYLVREEGRKYRLLGWVFVLGLAMFAFAQARFFYPAPLYPMLIAAGSVVWERWVAGLRHPRLASSVLWSGIALGGAAFALLVLPVAPLGSRIWNLTSGIHDEFREEIGWDDLAREVARVYDALPPEERLRTGLLTGNYGEGGALNLYGPALGLPHAMCGTNSFWYRGFDPKEPQTVVLVGFDLDEGQELFESCRVAGRNENQWNVTNEESRDHPDILVCRRLRHSWPDFWKKFRRFG